jgi:hypothetical protein
LASLRYAASELLAGAAPTHTATAITWTWGICQCVYVIYSSKIAFDPFWNYFRSSSSFFEWNQTNKSSSHPSPPSVPYIKRHVPLTIQNVDLNGVEK